MGLGATCIGVLAHLKSLGYLPSRPKVVEIGAQQLSNDFLEAKDRLALVGNLFGTSSGPRLGDLQRTGIAHGSLQHLAAEAPAASEFYRWLGFEYSAVDIDGSPKELSLDLNFDEVPAAHRRAYHLVTNFGTTEHVANQLNAFKIIHDLCALDGLMVHELPLQGYMNHGLINYNAKFFWMLARSNGYDTVLMDLSADDAAYELPANIADFVGKFPGVANRAPFKATDAALVVVLRKIFDVEFVPPLDIPTGAGISNEAVQSRYSTVFNQRIFAATRGGLRFRIRRMLIRLSNRLVP